MSAYCQAMKVIYDQLTNVGPPITDEQLVLQILTGLTEQYEGIALLIQQSKPLPDFYEAHSRLCMAETRKVNQARNAAKAVGTSLNTVAECSDQPSRNDRNQNQPERGRGRGCVRGCGRGRGSARGRRSLATVNDPFG
ncbi:uncharacterized protein LOC110900657 [Helianthus annuus]|uniref:uncharacterized protein LOC110900657 n=1 Tax=Helianthus annuus TaxID=4232 RepID=UPI000B8F78DE|nr:uncharacterized protein LOC110900657 [Helianthus annuus]